MITIEGSPDGKSPLVPNSSTTINPKDPYGKPFSYEVESLEYGQSKDMVTTTAEHTSDRSSTRAHVFDSDSGRWIVPELYSPTNVSLGNVPGYDNYIAPEPKEIVEPARTRSKTRASKFVLPSSIEPPSSEEDVDHDECETDASSGDDAPSQPVLLRKVLTTSQSVQTSSNPQHPCQSKCTHEPVHPIACRCQASSWNFRRGALRVPPGRHVERLGDPSDLNLQQHRRT